MKQLHVSIFISNNFLKIIIIKAIFLIIENLISIATKVRMIFNGHFKSVLCDLAFESKER